MTQRELDQTKGDLVRALRRRASELDAAVAPVELDPGRSMSRRRRYPTTAAPARKPAAFFMRETFLAMALPATAAE